MKQLSFPQQYIKVDLLSERVEKMCLSLYANLFKLNNASHVRRFLMLISTDLLVLGYYADVEARCQVFRVCSNTDLTGKGSTILVTSFTGGSLCILSVALSLSRCLLRMREERPKANGRKEEMTRESG